MWWRRRGRSIGEELVGRRGRQRRIGSAIQQSTGGAEKTEQEGDEGTAIVAATMEEESEDIEVGVRIERTSPHPFGAGKKMRRRMKVVVVIYEGGRIPGAAEEGAAAGEMTG